MRGKIEAVRGGAVVGWVWDEGRPDQHVRFELLVNGALVGQFDAGGFRDDLREHGIGRGDHGFEVPLAPGWCLAGPNEFRIRAVGTDADALVSLVETIEEPALPAEEATPTAAEFVRGRVERVDRGVLHGWIWDTRADDPVGFFLRVNGNDVGSFVADQPRGDLSQAGIGSGRHAFNVRLDAAWLALPETVLAVRTADGVEVGDPLALDASATRDALAATAQANARASNDAKEAPSRRATSRSDRQQGEPGVTSVGSSSAELVALMQGWSTMRMVAFHASLEKDVLLERAKALFRAKSWSELAEFDATAQPNRRGRPELDTLIGRALLHDDDPSRAAAFLGTVAIANARNANANFYASIAHARAGDLERATHFGRVAVAREPRNVQYLIDHATHCRRYAARSVAEPDVKRAALVESIETYRRAVAVDTRRIDFCLLNIARSQTEIESFDDAVATLEELLAIDANHIDALVLLSRTLVSVNRVKYALSVAERALEIDPSQQMPRFLVKSLRTLVEENELAPPTFGVATWDAARKRVVVEKWVESEGTLRREPVTSIEFGASPAAAIAAVPVDWLVLDDEVSVDLDAETLRAVRKAAMSWAGRVQTTCRGRTLCFWRRELLVSLAESGVVDGVATLGRSLEAVDDVVTTLDMDAPNPRRFDLPADIHGLERGPVVVMSRHGIIKFGGGEHFLESMAEHYAAMGFAPITVGTRPERLGDEGVEKGRAFAFVDMQPSSLRAYFLRVRPRFVHVLSGLGFQVAEALEHLDIPFFYGVHFWRDCLGFAEDDEKFFASHDREPIAKPSFRFVIEKAAVVYSNSEYTRAVLEESFAIRTPVIYSLPREVDDQRPGTDEEVDAILHGARDYVLIVNSKSEKGFDLVLETARRAPYARFLAIASQSDRREAEAAIAAAGISNFAVIDHTPRMDIVYSRARAVAVPSYRFIETFSRVCIEAQRYGKPVLGSTIGNVPYLLRRSGVVLPEDPAAWTAAVRRIYNEPDHYEALCQAARENAVEYAYDRQRSAVDGMISTVPTRILIGIGSGLGNMLHVGPMIRNIARRLGRKVDLVMTEDHSNTHFLLQNDEYVNAVYSMRPEILRRRYDRIFITHCFGNARLPFHSPNVIYARDWTNFEPSGPHHEAIYNLESAKEMLGIPYEPEDVQGYYVGNYRWSRPAGPVKIGVHGGSKDGFWKSKRWPGHAELAGRLQALGFEVVSFGIAEEYVPGTTDMTGGTIAEMVERILGMSYFLSNDSGLMNIANALGMPVLGLFGPTNGETRGPLSAQGRWVAIEKDCAPCEVSVIGRETFKAGECACIGELTVERVEAAVLQHLRDVGLLTPLSDVPRPLRIVD